MGTKLGPHVIHPTPDAKYLIERGSPLVKFLDDFGPAAQYLAINPRLKLFGRIYSDISIEYYMGLSSPEAAGREFVQRQEQKYRLNPLITHWEGHNEPALGKPDDPATLGRFQWFNRFEEGRIQELAKLGLAAVVGNFSTGYPEIHDLKYWQALLPMLLAARMYGGVLGLHEYAAPFIWTWTGGYQDKYCDQPENRTFPGPDGFHAGWLTLRYRQVYDRVLKPAGIGDLLLIINEFGCDAAGGGCGMPNGAWHDLIPFWFTHDGATDPIEYWRGSERDPAKYYAKQMRWYDHELQKDPYVIGATIFAYGGGDTWKRFEVSGTNVSKFLVEDVVAPPPPPTPPTGDSMAINLSELDYANHRPWDVNDVPQTIFMPVGMGFDYVRDQNVRITWRDIKVGSPTYGQMRTTTQPFGKPEVVIKPKDSVPDIPYPIGVEELLKGFAGWRPIWVLYYLFLKLAVGGKYRLTWPVWPNLLSSDEEGVKVYADDPAAGWLRLRVSAGEIAPIINAGAGVGDSWYNGRDFAFGSWFSPQVVIDATQPVMCVALEAVSIFGLKDSDFLHAPPTMEVIQAPGGDNGGDPNPPPIPGTTVRSLVSQLSASANAAEAGVQTVKTHADALKNLVG